MSAHNPFSSNADGAEMHGEFMAFTGDEEASVTLRDWAQRQGFQAATVQQGGADLFAQMLESAAPPKMAIVDIDGQADAVAVIARLCHVCGTECKLIALGSANDVSLYRRMMKAGAVDYLVKPLTQEGLRQAMTAAMKSSRSATPHVKEAKTIVVMGSRGGIGVSTIALNLGWLLADEMHANTALLDLDLQFGIASLSLDLEPGHGLRDIVSSPHRVDGLMIASSMATARDLFSVLAAEEALDEVVPMDHAAITALLQEMKNNFDYLIVDLPRHLFATHKRLLMTASDIVLVTELSLAGIRDTLRLKAVIKNIECPAPVTIIAARMGHIDANAFEKGAQVKIDFTIHEDTKSVALAANKGKPLGEVAKNAQITKTLLDLARKIHGRSDMPESKMNFMQRWFGNIPVKKKAMEQ